MHAKKYKELQTGREEDFDGRKCHNCGFFAIAGHRTPVRHERCPYHVNDYENVIPTFHLWHGGYHTPYNLLKNQHQPDQNQQNGCLGNVSSVKAFREAPKEKTYRNKRKWN